MTEKFVLVEFYFWRASLFWSFVCGVCRFYFVGWHCADIFFNLEIYLYMLRTLQNGIIMVKHARKLKQIHRQLKQIRRRVYIEKTFRNLNKSNRNEIVFAIFRLISNSKRIEPFAVPNQSVYGKYYLISVWFNKISKSFLCFSCPKKMS